jgi:hypothetical protein
MKWIKKSLFFLLFALVSMMTISCSLGNITETYEQTPMHTKAVGEGTSNFTFIYRGKNYILIRGNDGRFYAIEKPQIGGE